MTALYFETEDEQQIDTAHFDGYCVDRILDEVIFITKIVDGKLQVTISPDDEGYFSTLNTEYWLKRVTDYVQDYDVFIHPENGEDVYLVTDEPYQPVEGVVGKVVTFADIELDISALVM